MTKEKCWVWFKEDEENKGCWKSGFLCTQINNRETLIESVNYTTCKIENWRISHEEPEDFSIPPEKPIEGKWFIKK